MQSEMRRPEMPPIDRYVEAVDERLRAEIRVHRRSIPPPWLISLFRHLKGLAKPLAQSGAMALTALVVIVAISATPAARSGDLVAPRTGPLAAPNEAALVESDLSFRDYLPAGDTLAIQEADISDIGDDVAE